MESIFLETTFYKLGSFLFHTHLVHTVRDINETGCASLLFLFSRSTCNCFSGGLLFASSCEAAHTNGLIFHLLCRVSLVLCVLPLTVSTAPRGCYRWSWWKICRLGYDLGSLPPHLHDRYWQIHTLHQRSVKESWETLKTIKCCSVKLLGLFMLCTLV